MIDLHNHLLPGIDDGAPNLETSVALARVALEEGITHLVCTPHIHPGRFDNSPRSIGQALDLFREALAKEGLPLTVSAAAEVHYGLELMEDIPRGLVPFLGKWEGMDVLLLEFPHGYIPLGADRLTKWLIGQGVLPMIAHPERNKGVMRTPDKLQPFLNQGCLLQVTADSVAGRFGEACQQTAQKLLRESVVTILASDAHNLEHRPPSLRAGVDAAAAIVGADAAEKLVRDTPWQIAAAHFSSASVEANHSAPPVS
jgi:protein-tyrosine phosphatase